MSFTKEFIFLQEGRHFLADPCTNAEAGDHSEKHFEQAESSVTFGGIIEVGTCKKKNWINLVKVGYKVHRSFIGHSCSLLFWRILEFFKLGIFSTTKIHLLLENQFNLVEEKHSFIY